MKGRTCVFATWPDMVWMHPKVASYPEACCLISPPTPTPLHCKLKHNPSIILTSVLSRLTFSQNANWLTKAVLFEMLAFGKLWPNLSFMAIQPSDNCVCLKSTWPSRSNPNSHPYFCQRFSSARKRVDRLSMKAWKELQRLWIDLSVLLHGYFLRTPVTLSVNQSLPKAIWDPGFQQE